MLVSTKMQRKKLVSWLVKPSLYALSSVALLYLLFLFPLVLAELIWGKIVDFHAAYFFLAQFFTLGGASLAAQITNRSFESKADSE